MYEASYTVVLVHDLTSFGLTILVVSGALSAALLASKLSARTSIPSAALFLVAAALASDLWPSLVLSIQTVERIATVALIVILFDGGSSIGWRRLRASLLPIASLGVLGTFATAGLVAAFAHWAFGLAWVTSGLLGAAIAPTDPAVMFSVLGEREISGRTGTILEGESGANDPVGIALMLGMIELGDSCRRVVLDRRARLRRADVDRARDRDRGRPGRARPDAARRPALRRALHLAHARSRRDSSTASRRSAHGSGFLAVFVAGLLIGDLRAPFGDEIQVFQDGLAALAEIVVFVALGLTINLSGLTADRWVDGLLLAAFAALIARPLALGALLAPARLRSGERLFVIWGGLKGAVPILLAAFALGRHVADAQRIYETVFVVVLASVIVQGGTMGIAARRLGVERRA